MSKNVISSMLRGTLQSVFRINTVALKVVSGVLQVRNNADTADAPLKASALQLSSGAGAGKILASDASGNATWVDGTFPAANVRIVGEISFFGFSPKPAGWLLCDGSAVSRTTYAALFAAIGIEYGPGDSSTTFNLPDLAGRFLLGAGNNGEFTHSLGERAGEEDHALLLAEMPAHTHTIPRVNTGGGGTTSFERITTAATVTQIASSSQGSGNAHNNMPPYGSATPAIYAGV